MVARLAQMLGIARKNIYCVGDNQNDIPMMALSAVPFAPANCAQEVKDWGAHILCHCDDGVIGDIMEIPGAAILKILERERSTAKKWRWIFCNEKGEMPSYLWKGR